MSTTTPAGSSGDSTDAAITNALAALPTASAPEPAATASEDAGNDDGELGDAGKRALGQLRAKLREERTARLAAERVAAERTDADDADRIRRDAETAANVKANARIVRAEIRALAANRFADPADAVVFLDPADFDVDADGEVDRDDIASALDALLAKKPHLGKPDQQRPPRPDPSQGASDGGAPSTAQQFEAALRGRL